MDVYYKNETLFVNLLYDVTTETMTLLERRIFKIIDAYGVDKITVSIEGKQDKELLNQFKRKYYHSYKGFLLIK